MLLNESSYSFNFSFSSFFSCISSLKLVQRKCNVVIKAHLTIFRNIIPLGIEHWRMAELKTKNELYPQIFHFTG